MMMGDVRGLLALIFVVMFCGGGVYGQEGMQRMPVTLKADEEVRLIIPGDVVEGVIATGSASYFNFSAPETEADVTLTLSAPLGGDVDIFCATNTGFFSDTLPRPVYPYYYWKSSHRTGNDTIFISRRSMFSVFGEGKGYNCLVYGFANSAGQSASAGEAGGGGGDATFFSVDLQFYLEDTVIDPLDKEGIIGIFNACCVKQESACGYWKSAGGIQREASVDFCHVGGSHCDADGHLKILNMRALDLRCDGFPSAPLSKMRYLQHLDLSRNVITDSSTANLTKFIAESPALKIIKVSDNKLSGFVDAEELCLANDRLVALDLGRNSLDGELPGCLFQSTTIQDIDLEENNFTGSLPASYPSDSRLRHLDLTGNNLRGPLPFSFFSSNSHLSEVKLGGNGFTGVLPTGIRPPTVLAVLDLSKNALEGAIPEWVASIGTLEFIDLSSNAFDSVPATFDGGSLIFAVLSQNNLRGTFPDFSKNKGLTFLVLSDNLLSGPLPKGSLYPELRIFDVSNNAFSGDVDDTWRRTAIFNDTIPFGLGYLQHVLDVSYNDLTNVTLNLTAAQGGFDGHISLNFGGNPLCSVEYVQRTIAETTFQGEIDACFEICNSTSTTNSNDTMCVEASAASITLALEKSLEGSTITSSTSTSSDSGGGLSSAALIGIIAGSVAAVALVSAVGVVFYLKHRKKRAVAGLFEKEEL